MSTLSWLLMSSSSLLLLLLLLLLQPVLWYSSHVVQVGASCILEKHVTVMSMSCCCYVFE
jgi:hypothetical protein